MKLAPIVLAIGIEFGIACTQAALPSTIEPPITTRDREHWSFRPLERPSLPPSVPAFSPNNEVDLFVHQSLRSRGLTPANPASKRTLIRRLSFDLTGLPPTEEEIQRFVSNKQPDAYNRLVDKLLASPAYGERWAQHWLDLARFAESDGFEHDLVRSDAWRYRDWVIQAFNRDLPYDEFVQFQIAGDELGRSEQDDAHATGFLLAGPDMPDINLTEERRHIVLNEITATVGAVFSGLGVGCAQCHDHKFDPISQADFYRLRAFFDNTAFPQRNKQLGHIISENSNKRSESYLAVRGDFRRQGMKLTAAYPRIANHRNQHPQPKSQDSNSTFQRTELAHWLTQADHPLTSRVMVNRLWQHHFGKALVATPNDFGTQGARPSHPELLDYLATELVRQKWRLKQMHKLLVQSSTYMQASRGTGIQWEKAIREDPSNQWYSRMNRRRLTGETLRDAMLAATHSLNERQGGPSDRPPLPAEVHATLLRKNHWITSPDESDHYRRSIYVFVRRNLRYPMFDVFDRPDANASCARRSVTTTAPQSLNLLNSEFSLSRARALATLVKPKTGSDLNASISKLFSSCLGRPPSNYERETLINFIEERQQNSSTGEDVSSELQTNALVDAALAMFNLNEFLYID